MAGLAVKSLRNGTAGRVLSWHAVLALAPLLAACGGGGGGEGSPAPVSVSCQNGSTSTAASVAAANAACPARYAETGDVADSVQAALGRLPANQALVLRRYYLEDATLDEIAVELRVSKERVRQLRAAAEKRLRGDILVMALWESMLQGDRAA